MLEQNTQHGFGVTQMTSTDTILPDEVHQFYRDEQPWGTDRNLCQVYVQNFPRICESETLNRHFRIYLRYLCDDTPMFAIYMQWNKNLINNSGISNSQSYYILHTQLFSSLSWALTIILSMVCVVKERVCLLQVSLSFEKNSS